MTVREALTEGRKALTGYDTETPHLDSSLLLAHACAVSRERLYMNLGEALDNTDLTTYRQSIERRIAGEPVAWIVGIKEFWGREFSVGPGVLCPRPDSEVLIEASMEIMDGYDSGGGRLHDCCCGPGTLAITLAAERPSWDISASDISDDAAAYFRRNNRTLAGGRVGYAHTDLMEGVFGPFEIIISNPPYLTPAETDDRKVLGWKEPELALNGGGDDGLDLIRRLIPRVSARLVSGGAFLMEADPLQMPKIRQILSHTGFKRLGTRRDLAGRERMVIGFKGSI